MNAPISSAVTLGLGLLSIGRAWGHRPGMPPSEDQALDLLHHAATRGIRFFDTAPAYGSSERLFGRFLKEAGAVSRNLVVSTKMGEHWNAETESAFVDHSYDALCRSLDRSLALLGRIDLLQIHKATSEALASKDVERAIDYAKSVGVTTFGASISDPSAAHLACESGLYTSLQFPYNRLQTGHESVFPMARAADMAILINRPFAMGQIIAEGSGDPIRAMADALAFIRQNPFRGTILTGTRSTRHLDESIAAFGG